MDCVEWTGCKTKDGYGIRAINGTTQTTHRIAYEEQIGQIPKGLQIHHVCENRACMNVKHLRLVTPRENVLMSNSFAAHNAKKTHCKHGHEFTKENTRVWRKMRLCRKCNTINKRRSRLNKL